MDVEINNHEISQYIHRVRKLKSNLFLKTFMDELYFYETLCMQIKS